MECTVCHMNPHTASYCNNCGWDLFKRRRLALSPTRLAISTDIEERGKADAKAYIDMLQPNVGLVKVRSPHQLRRCWPRCPEACTSITNMFCNCSDHWPSLHTERCSLLKWHRGPHLCGTHALNKSGHCMRRCTDGMKPGITKKPMLMRKVQSAHF